MTDAWMRAALVTSQSVEVAIAARAVLVLAAALVIVACMRRSPAALRALVLAAAFGVLALLPIGALLLPAFAIDVPGAGASAHIAEPFAPFGALDVRPLLLSGDGATERHAAAGGPPVWPSVPALLRAAWAFGALACLLPWLLAVRHVRSVRRSARQWVEHETLVRHLATQAGVRRRIELLTAEQIPAPMTCGLLRPVIVCPADARSWSATDLRHTLLHEIEHVRRGDWAVYLLARTICAVYWFLPLVWMAWRRLGLETEHACDDAVVRQGDAAAYVQQLVSLARRMSAGGRRPVLAMASRRDLSRRVHAALDRHQRRGRAGAAGTTAVLAAAGLLAMVVAPLQARDVAPQDGPAQDAAVFEVASVKRSPPQSQPPGAGAGGGRAIGPRAGTTSFTAIGVPLRDLLRYAYGLEPFQPIDGAPRWIDDRFDIVARMPVPDPAPEAARHMMRALLADRFELAMAWDTREQPMYALVPVRTDGALAPALARSMTDCQAWHAAQRAASDARGTGPLSTDAFDALRRPACGMVVQPFAGIIHAGATTMAELAVLLSRSPAVGRPVIDRTGLDGSFDFQLSFAPDVPQASAASAVYPPLALALEEQLGLRLQRIRGPMDVLVIRHIEPPDED